MPPTTTSNPLLTSSPSLQNALILSPRLAPAPSVLMLKGNTSRRESETSTAADETERHFSSTCRRTTKMVFAVFLVMSLGCLAVVAVTVPAIRQQILLITDWASEQGLAGSLVCWLLLTVAIILCFPCSMIEILVSFVYGPWIGFAVSVLGKQAGCLMSFLLGRTYWRKPVERWIKKHPKFYILDRALGNKELKVVFLLRLMYIPIGLKNYGLSILNVSWTAFFWCTLGANIPYSVLFAYMGSTADNLMQAANGESSFGAAQIATIAVGVVTILAFGIWIGIETRRIFKAAASTEANTSSSLDLSMSEVHVNLDVSPSGDVQFASMPTRDATNV